jgi:hypothetical protein
MHISQDESTLSRPYEHAGADIYFTLVVLYADAAICYILKCFILHVAEIRYHVPGRPDEPARDIGGGGEFSISIPQHVSMTKTRLQCVRL